MNRPEDDRRALPALTMSVVVPAYNARTFLEKSLPPLISIKERGEISEIIVADDGSTDGTAEKAVGLGARVVTSNGRSGPAAARNVAAASVTDDVIWFVDADVVVNDDAAIRIRRVLAETGATAVFGSYDDEAPARNFLSQYKNKVHRHNHRVGGDVSSFWAGCGAVRREAFVSVGGFDAKTYPRPSIEDIELGYRLRDRGHRIVLDPTIEGTHLKVWHLKNLLVTEVRDRALPWSLLLLGRGAIGTELNLTWAERARAFLACLLVLVVLTGFVGLTPWWLPILVLVAAFAANRELFGLFRRHNSVAFAFGGLIFHQLYYLYSTAVFVWCWAKARLRTRAVSRAAPGPFEE